MNGPSVMVHHINEFFTKTKISDTFADTYTQISADAFTRLSSKLVPIFTNASDTAMQPRNTVHVCQSIHGPESGNTTPAQMAHAYALRSRSAMSLAARSLMYACKYSSSKKEFMITSLNDCRICLKLFGMIPEPYCTGSGVHKGTMATTR